MFWLLVGTESVKLIGSSGGSPYVSLTLNGNIPCNLLHQLSKPRDKMARRKRVTSSSVIWGKEPWTRMPDFPYLCQLWLLL